MDFIYKMFDWTWHLSTFGNVLWGIFMMIIGFWYALGWMVVLSFEEETWWKAFRNTGIYALLPVLVISITGFVGYLING